MSTNATATAEAAEAAAKAILSVDQHVPIFRFKGLSFGPYIMSLFMDSALFGVMITQLMHWWTYSREDRRFVKVIVYVSTLLGAVTTVYIVVFNMHLFAYGFGMYAPFESVAWLGWFPLIDSIISTIIQVFYVDRAYRLNGKNPVVLIVVGALMVASFGAALGTKIKFSLLKVEAEASQIDTFVYIWLGTVLVTDIGITGLVGWGLYKSRTGWSDTDRLVKRLIILACETQLPPCLIAIGFLVEYAINPPSSLGVFFECVQGKVYICGFLATLNARYHLRREMEDETSLSVQKRSNTFALASNRLQQATVQITTDTYVESYQMPELERRSRNRDPQAQVYKEGLDDSDGGSVDKLDYAANPSRTGLNQTSGVDFA